MNVEQSDSLFSRAERALAVALVLFCFLVSVAAPLASYLVAVAVFGLVHVGAELRFVDRAFAGRLPARFVAGVATPVALALTARMAGQIGWSRPAVTIALELACGALMALVAVATMRHRRAAGAAIALALVCCSVFAPFECFLLLAIGHNLTPLAFVADSAPAPYRRRLLLWLAATFVALPLLIASGWPGELMQTIGLFAPEASVFAAGPLEAHMPSYVPARLLDTDWAVPIFSACVFAQTMHYAAVIHILPRLVGDAPRSTIAPWPRRSFFLVALAIAAALSVAFFLADYGLAKKSYALAALVHSWIEIPILIMALGAGAAQANPNR